MTDETPPSPDAIIDQGVDDIWQHCRENLDSLDSAGQCKVIRGMINHALAELRAVVESMAATAKRQKAQNRGLRKDVKRLRAELAAAKNTRKVG